MALTTKRRVFVEEYLRCWNAAEAARGAGYAHPDRQGYRLLRIVEIREIVAQRVGEKAMSADEILLRLADQARGTIADFVSIGEDGSVRVDLAKAEKAGVLRLIKKLEETKDGIKVELYDAQSALIKLGEGHGLWRTRHEHTGPDGGPIEFIEVTPGEDSGE